MPVPIDTRAEKYLNNLLSYRQITNDADFKRSVQLSEGEQPLGIYKPEEHNESILVTMKGIHILSAKGDEFLAYGVLRSQRIVAEKSKLSNATTSE